MEREDDSHANHSQITWKTIKEHEKKGRIKDPWKGWKYPYHSTVVEIY